MRRLAATLSVAAVAALAACSGGGAGPAAAQPAGAVVRIESPAVAGDAGLLAAELLLSSGGQPPSPLHPAAPLGAGLLGKRIAKTALDHLRSELGSGNGPSLEGSARIRRLAQSPGAPPDSNGDGRNLDETLAAELQRLGPFAGASLPQGALPLLFPWRQGTADLRGPLGLGQQPDMATWRTVAGGDTTLRLVDVASAMRARSLAAGRLLQQSHGTLVGDDDDDGLHGLVCVEQVLAAEETLLSSWFTDGGPLGAIASPRTYDPANGAFWLPAEVAASLDPTAGDLVLGYRARDGASDLTGLAAVIDASSELVWLARDDQPSATTHAVFRGAPFEPPDPGPPPPHVLNWDDDIFPLVNLRCAGCHLGFPTGGWQMDTYALALAGTPATRAAGLTMVIPGNHAQSLMYRILVGPPAPFFRMPYLSAQLPQAEIQRVADWIDAGGLQRQPTPPPPPQRGTDLARVSFCNLVALHLDAGGGLHHRREVDGPSGIATALATGRALQALARLAAAMPTLSYQQLAASDVLARAAHFAGDRLLAADGRAYDSVAVAGPPGTGGEPAGLDGQAALAAGLQAAFAVLPTDTAIAIAADRARSGLLAFRDPQTSTFGSDPAHRGALYAPGALADLLQALRLGRLVDGGLDGVRIALLERLAPALAFAEWPGRGEVLGDGIADTDGNGTPEPAAAGGAFGRLPLLVGGIAVGSDADRAVSAAVTWSEHVRPLLFGKCGECHFSGTSQGDYRLDTLLLANTPGQSHGVVPLIVPGDPDHSLLYRKLVDRRPPVGVQMPQQHTPLDARACAMVRQWIQDGATGR
jgi:hypothetical protein